MGRQSFIGLWANPQKAIYLAKQLYAFSEVEVATGAKYLRAHDGGVHEIEMTSRYPPALL